MPHRRHDDLPPATTGFEAVHRYWNSEHNGVMAKIKPGEYYVSRTGEALTTVLGSCVAACIRDPGVGVGGMNHFMLPIKAHTPGAVINDALRYGNFAMEHLINDIIKYGGRKANLEIKVFGGANVGGIGQDVGRTNIDFITRYLQGEKLKVTAQDVGGTQARKIIFFPDTGKILLKKLAVTQGITNQDRDMVETLKATPVSGEVELFV